jgi:PST family polysaccharide transporter
MFKQFGWLAGAKLTQGIVGLLAALAVARALGPAEFGSLSLAIAIASFVSLVSALGLEQIATRELVMSGGSPQRTITLLRRLRLAGALIGSSTLLALAILPPVSALGASGLVLILALLPIAQVGDVSEWRLLAAGDGRRVALAVLLTSPVAALARCALALLGYGPTAFAWTLVAEWAARSALLAWMTRAPRPSTGIRSEQPLLETSFNMLKESIPFLLASISVFVYMRIDQFMIAGILGAEHLGLYSAMVTLAEIPLVVPALLLRASLPMLARISQTDPARRDLELMRIMGASVYLHAAIGCILALVAEPVFVLLFGAPFRDAAAAFSIQVFAAPFVALGVLSSAWLVLERKTGHALRRTLLGAVANILLNLIFIPTWGIAGAAIATVVSQLLATYAADALYPGTRALFMMKTRALWPGNWSRV